jgi:hypothetical protein
MVKDLRTDHETGNTQAVLDGALDPFMAAYLKWRASQRRIESLLFAHARCKKIQTQN